MNILKSNKWLKSAFSAGAIVLGFILAITIYKERLSKKQLIGYVFGIAAVVLLNL